MLKGLTLFELKFHLKQGSFWAVAFCFVWMAVLVSSQVGSALLFANSPYAIARGMLVISPQIIFVLCVLASTSLTRDSEYNMEPLLFTTPIDKFQYLASRYFGIVAAALVLFLLVVIAMMTTLLFLKGSTVAAFNLGDYMVNFFIFFVPNILLCSSVVFVTAMLSKNTIAIYVSGVVIYIIYMLASVLGNSPLMAGSNSLLSDSSGFAALLEPYGLMAFIEQSAFWTGEQRNELMPVLSGNLLFNRLLWLAVSVSLFAFAYHKFSFRIVNSHSKNAGANNDAPSTYDAPGFFQSVVPQKNLNVFLFSIWLSKLKLEYLNVVKGRTFIVLTFVTMVFSLGNIMGNTFDGPINNGQPFYPLTSLILEFLRQPLTDIGMLVAVFYSVELYWHERSLKTDSIIDVTPTRNLTFYLAKLFTVLLVCFTLISASIITAIGFQLSQGMWNVQPWLYLILYYYAGVPILAITLIVFGLQRLAKTKALGLMLGLVAFMTPVIVSKLGLSHPLTVIAYRPYFIFSDMADTIYHDDALHWYNLYWLSFGFIIALLTVKYWQRGMSNVAQQFTHKAHLLMSAAILSLIVSGSYVYYQTNIFNDFLTKEQSLQLGANYEHKYAKLADLPQPTVVDINVNVDIYPSERRYTAKGEYIVENQTESPINNVMVSIFRQPHIEQALVFNDATLERYDDIYQAYFYQLNHPMQPGEQRTVSFDFSVTHNAFSELDGEHYVTKGGSYIELEDIMPVFGYDERYALENGEERIKRGLSPLKLTEPTKVMNKVSDDWVNFETVVSTNAEQTVAAVGQLQRQWLEGERHYFHYKTKQKVKRQLAYTSAIFERVTASHKGVEITMLHSKAHQGDTHFTLEALKHTMDYFSQNYGPYRLDQFTVVELPYFSSAQSFGSAQPGMYLGVENRFFNLDNSKVDIAEFNPLLRGVSHEFAHQYWGGYIEPHYVGGYALLTETLCKYTELVLAKKLYGEYSTNVEVHLSIDRYLRGRPYNDNIEQPLFSTGMEPHIYYAKGKQTMHALLDLLGEEKINQALRSLLEKHGYPNKPTSLDLLDEFYLVADQSQHSIIDDLFKRVVFHDFDLHSANVKLLPNGEYETTIDVSTSKLVLNRETNKEQRELINDDIDIALYTGFPEVDNSNLLLSKKVHVNKNRSTVILRSNTKPSHVQVDPNRYRIDRNIANNLIAID